MSELATFDTKSLDGETLELTPGAFEKPTLRTPQTENRNEANVLNGQDPNDTADPQNWSFRKKCFVFAALMSSSILADG